MYLQDRVNCTLNIAIMLFVYDIVAIGCSPEDFLQYILFNNSCTTLDLTTNIMEKLGIQEQEAVKTGQNWVQYK